MAAGALDLLPQWRAWQQNGVDFLLADAPLPAPYSLCLDAISARPAARSSVRPAAPPTSAQRGTPPPRPSGPSGLSDARTAPPAARPPRPQAAPPPPAAPEAPTLRREPSPALPQEQWPAVWQARLRATRPAVVLWTYWALGEDLCLTPNAERRDLFRRLLGDLGHPSGTHSFWPAALPGENGLEAHPQAFWSGAELLKSRAIVVMGSAAMHAVDLPVRLRPFQQTRHNGRMLIVLPDADFLVREPNRYDAVREFLRQALQAFVQN